MRFDSEFETLIGWIEGHMTFFWRILENNTSRTMTNHDEPWWNITNRDSETSQTMTKPWQWNITTHHDRSWNIMKHYEPLQSTINHHNLYKNYCKLSRKKNVLQHEYILFPYNIYLYQKLTDRDLPKKRTLTSPTLLILFKKLTYFENQQEINFH